MVRNLWAPCSFSLFHNYAICAIRIWLNATSPSQEAASLGVRVGVLHKKTTGVLVGNFEKNPQEVSTSCFLGVA